MPEKRHAFAILLLFILLLGAAWWAADLQAAWMHKWLSNGGVPPPGNPWKGRSEPTIGYYLTINSVCIALIFLIPAMALFVLRRPGGPGPQWLMFWTVALFAFLTHLWVGIGDVLPRQCVSGWPSQLLRWPSTAHLGQVLDFVWRDCQKPPRVTHPSSDTITALWWTADVALAWYGAARPGWVRPRWEQIERGILHLTLFLSALGSSIVLSSNGYVRVVGLFFLLSTLLSAIYRVVVYPFDPDAAAARAYVLFFQGLNQFLPWYRLSTWPAVLNLGALRIVLRKHNLHDTSTIPVTNPDGLAPAPVFMPDDLIQRNMDGFFNDLSKPQMGSSSDPNKIDAQSMNFTVSNPGARFGRNVPLSEAFPKTGALLTPNPRRISNELLARTKLFEACSLNFLAAAWIQFQTHDWFNHGEPKEGNEFEVSIEGSDAWHECPMKVRRTRADPTRDYDKEHRENRGELKFPPTYVNAESHWWDASQIYGSNPQTTLKLRTDYRSDRDTSSCTRPLMPDGKLFLQGGDLVIDPSNHDDPNETGLTGFSGNWWAGLSLLHTLFAREHNAICDHLRSRYPAWNSDQLFHTARMINSALMAKIHTVEWTPAILATPPLEIGMNANWWGLLTETLHRAYGRLSENEAFSGIPLSGVDHSGADYCLTEEFVSVYRLHPLMRDDLSIHSAKDGSLIATRPMVPDLVGNLNTMTVFKDPRWSFADVLYSFGIAHPGAITVHNYPNFLRKLERPDGECVDLATIDVLRDRERGVPRYNRFLQLFHKKPIRSFDDLANDKHPNLPAELRAVYGQTNGRDNVDDLDLMVGLFSEVVPPGFGFSDTAFRVFILMASRRLKSDRFIARDFVPEIYTPEGIAWVNDNSFVSTVLRHFPELRPALYDVKNGFKPWKKVGQVP